MAKPIASPHERGYVIDGEKLLNGQRLAKEAHSWMEKNEESFREIYGYVKRMQGRGTVGRVRDRVAAFCADRGIKVGNDEYAFGNAYWAGISRYLVLYDASLLTAPIKFNDSDIDCHGLFPVSWLPEIEEER